MQSALAVQKETQQSIQKGSGHIKPTGILMETTSLQLLLQITKTISLSMESTFRLSL